MTDNNLECIICGDEIKEGDICNKQSCRDRYNKVQKEKMKTQGGIYSFSKEERKKLIERKNISGEYIWNNNEKSLCMSTLVSDALEVIENQTRVDYEEVETHGPFYIKFRLANNNEIISVPDIYIEKYNLIISVRENKDIVNIEEYRVLLNNYDFNYIQLYNKEDINQLPNTIKKVQRAIENNNRYITPPRIMDSLISESRTETLNSDSLNIPYALVIYHNDKPVGLVLSRDVLLSDDVFHIDGKDLYITTIDEELKNNSLVIELKSYDVNILKIKEYLDLMDNPTMIDVLAYHIGIPMEYDKNQKLKEIIYLFGGKETLVTYNEYSSEFDDLIKSLMKEEETHKLTLDNIDDKLN